jgi:hypothetical protein
VKSGIYSIKRVLVSENMNVVMKDNRYINKLSKIKFLVQTYYPDLYKKYTLRSILKPNIEIKRIINWPMLLHELDESGALEGDTIFKHN